MLTAYKASLVPISFLKPNCVSLQGKPCLGHLGLSELLKICMLSLKLLVGDTWKVCCIHPTILIHLYLQWCNHTTYLPSSATSLSKKWFLPPMLWTCSTDWMSSIRFYVDETSVIWRRVTTFRALSLVIRLDQPLPGGDSAMVPINCTNAIGLPVL